MSFSVKVKLSSWGVSAKSCVFLIIMALLQAIVTILQTKYLPKRSQTYLMGRSFLNSFFHPFIFLVLPENNILFF